MTNLLVALFVLAGILMLVLSMPDCPLQTGRSHDWLKTCLERP